MSDFSRLSYRRKGEIKTTVTYLQMLERPLFPETSERRVPIVLLEKPDLHFYRYLYDLVGGMWNWTGRKLLSDEELLRCIDRPEVKIYVAYDGGNPAGYIETEKIGSDVEIVYWGIAPQLTSRGLGSALMRTALADAWNSADVRRVWVHTCDLDGPQALAAYRRFGFEIYDTREESVDLIEASLAPLIADRLLRS